MVVGRSGCAHSASNKQLSVFELSSRGKTMKHKLLVVKFTQNHHADCPCLPILHHLHLIEQSDSVDSKFDGRLGGVLVSIFKSILCLVISCLDYSHF